MLWCELDNIYPPANDYLFPYPKNVTLVSWRGGLTPTCLELTRNMAIRLSWHRVSTLIWIIRN